ncbi:MAG: phosphatase PAP2 family protein [Chloroflexi bacterium]|nr:phosphatase PAP2 family protein [Chloroflexota bacterium]
MLGYLAHRAYVFPGDLAVSSWLQAVDNAIFHTAMVALSFLGSTASAVVVVSISIIMLVAYRRRLEAVFVVSVTASGTALGQLLKWIIDRSRPGGEADGLSFPSGHTLYAVVFYGSLFYLAPRLIRSTTAIIIVRTVLALLILFTGISRIQLGAHWPSDVLGSFIFGGLLLVPATILYQRRLRRKTPILKRDA